MWRLDLWSISHFALEIHSFACSWPVACQPNIEGPSTRTPKSLVRDQAAPFQSKNHRCPGPDPDPHACLTHDARVQEFRVNSAAFLCSSVAGFSPCSSLLGCKVLWEYVGRVFGIFMGIIIIISSLKMIGCLQCIWCYPWCLGWDIHCLQASTCAVLLDKTTAQQGLPQCWRTKVLFESAVAICQASALSKWNPSLHPNWARIMVARESLSLKTSLACFNHVSALDWGRSILCAGLNATAQTLLPLLLVAGCQVGPRATGIWMVVVVEKLCCS